MKKKKYLDRKYGSRSCQRSPRGNLGFGKKKSLEELPFRESMRMKRHKQDPWGDFRYKEQVDWKPFDEFLMSKINTPWNDVYSELLTKVKEKNKFWLRDNLYWMVSRDHIYDEKGNACHQRYSYRHYENSRLLYDSLFVDKFGYLRYYETKEELIFNTKMILREKKLERILGLKN